MRKLPLMSIILCAGIIVCAFAAEEQALVVGLGVELAEREREVGGKWTVFSRAIDEKLMGYLFRIELDSRQTIVDELKRAFEILRGEELRGRILIHDAQLPNRESNNRESTLYKRSQKNSYRRRILEDERARIFLEEELLRDCKYPDRIGKIY